MRAKIDFLSLALAPQAESGVRNRTQGIRAEPLVRNGEFPASRVRNNARRQNGHILQWDFLGLQCANWVIVYRVKGNTAEARLLSEDLYNTLAGSLLIRSELQGHRAKISVAYAIKFPIRAWGRIFILPLADAKTAHRARRSKSFDSKSVDLPISMIQYHLTYNMARTALLPIEGAYNKGVLG